MQVACGLGQEVSVGRVSKEARARHRRCLLCAKSKHHPVCEDRASQSSNGTFILLVDAGLYEFVMALLRKDSSFDVVCAAPYTLRYLCSWTFCSSRDPIPCHDIHTGCLPFASFIDSCSTAFLFSAHKLRTPLLLLSLPLSKRADHLRKRYHLERLLMLLRLEDEDPTSSMVVSKIEVTRKSRSRKSTLSRRLGGADGAAIGARNPKSARGVLLQL